MLVRTDSRDGKLDFMGTVANCWTWNEEERLSPVEIKNFGANNIGQ